MDLSAADQPNPREALALTAGAALCPFRCCRSVADVAASLAWTSTMNEPQKVSISEWKSLPLTKKRCLSIELNNFQIIGFVGFDFKTQLISLTVLIPAPDFMFGTKSVYND